MLIKKRSWNKALRIFFKKTFPLKIYSKTSWLNQDNFWEENEKPTDGRPLAAGRKTNLSKENINYTAMDSNSSESEKVAK